MVRKRVFEIIEKAENKDVVSAIYDYAMIVIIILSLVPLAFKDENSSLVMINKITVGIFIVDYLLRWMTADLKFSEEGVKPFLKYPFSMMAIIDLGRL